MSSEPLDGGWLFPECAPSENRPETVPFMVQVLSDFYAWVLAGHCKIRERGGEIVSLRPNQAQIDTHKAMLTQAWRAKPIRLVRLKSRKVGVSTWIQALFYFLTKHISNSTALTVAHSREANSEIFEITARIKHFDPTARASDRNSRREIAYDIDHGSKFKTESAAGQYIGSGSTVFFLHMSELSKWPASEVSDQMLSLLNAVPDKSNTIVVIESTANRGDETGTFERVWKEAESGASDYMAVFTPWFNDPEARVPGGKLEGGRSDYEKKLADNLGVDDEQLAWLRLTLRNKCGGDELNRMQEYPSAPEEAFTTRFGRVFPMLKREEHNREIALEELRSGEWELYRAIDWGGAHPFVCLWIAHRYGPSAFSIDMINCLVTWDQLARYRFDSNNRVYKVEDDTCDALRYCVTTFHLSGHVHVYRELVMPDSAQKGFDELTLCKHIEKMSAGERYASGVADRSRPNSILLFGAHGVPVVPHTKPQTSVRGETEDGIALVNMLMSGKVNVRPGDKPRSEADQSLERWRNRQFDYDPGEDVLRLAVEEYGDGSSGHYHPLLGQCG